MFMAVHQRAALAASWLVITATSSLCAQSVTVAPGPVSSSSATQLRISGDGSTVLGLNFVTSHDLVLGRPWRWSAGTGYFEPSLPAGTNSGNWGSSSASGERAILSGQSVQPGPVYGEIVYAMIDETNATQTLPAPSGYGYGVSISGDGRTLLFGEHSSTGSTNGSGFAVVGPQGTRLVPPQAFGQHAAGFGLSHDGSVVGGLISPVVAGVGWGSTALLRWSGEVVAVPVSAAMPARTYLGGYGGISGDGRTLFGALFEGGDIDSPPGPDPLRPFIYSEERGFEFLPHSDDWLFVREASFDAGVALVTNSDFTSGYVWRRGFGEVAIAQFFANQGVDLSTYTDVRVLDMSYDARTFVASARLGDAYVPLIISVPAPTVLSVCGVGAGLVARRRRN